MQYLILSALVFATSSGMAAGVQETRDTETGMWSWKVENHGLSLELIQLLPDYVRAVYAARGLPKHLIEGVAAYCVFGTIAKNTSEGQLSYNVADWRYLKADGEQHPLKTKSQWVTEWRNMGVSYSWSILPDDQTLEVGDWSQGFTTVKVARESTFDLVYSWSIGGRKYVGTIENIRCAHEKNLD